jgi:phytanoyl-CoA hydroxylase
MKITPEQKAEWRQQYEEQGYLVVPHVLDAALIQAASDHVEWLQRKHPELRPERLGHTLLPDDPFWLRLVSDDRLLDIAELFIGPNIALFASHYICKPGTDGLPVLWHQDGAYWPLEPMEVVTLWLAVDDSTRENGCMRVIPGSHHETLKAMVRSEGEDNVLGSHMDAPVEESRAVDVEVRRGGVSVHHPNLVHGSNPNTSGRRRCGLTIRYIPASTRITREWKPFLLRGEDPQGRNTYYPFPAYREGEHFPYAPLRSTRDSR